jgi:hypothetical protein
MCRECSKHEGKTNAYRSLVGKSEENKPLGNIDVSERII